MPEVQISQHRPGHVSCSSIRSEMFNISRRPCPRTTFPQCAMTLESREKSQELHQANLTVLIGFRWYRKMAASPRCAFQSSMTRSFGILSAASPVALLSRKTFDVKMTNRSRGRLTSAVSPVNEKKKVPGVDYKRDCE